MGTRSRGDRVLRGERESANAAKNASGADVDVRVTEHSGELTVQVHDDGPGGADLARGTGLTGLQDRVAALGGRLTIESRPGAGTTVTARIPSR